MTEPTAGRGPKPLLQKPRPPLNPPSILKIIRDSRGLTMDDLQRLYSMTKYHPREYFMHEKLVDIIGSLKRSGLVTIRIGQDN